MHLSCVPLHSFQVKHPVFILSVQLLKSASVALPHLALSASAAMAQRVASPFKLAMIEDLSCVTGTARDPILQVQVFFALSGKYQHQWRPGRYHRQLGLYPARAYRGGYDWRWQSTCPG